MYIKSIIPYTSVILYYNIYIYLKNKVYKSLLIFIVYTKKVHSSHSQNLLQNKIQINVSEEYQLEMDGSNFKEFIGIETSQPFGNSGPIWFCIELAVLYWVHHTRRRRIEQNRKTSRNLHLSDPTLLLIYTFDTICYSVLFCYSNK